MKTVVRGIIIVAISLVSVGAVIAYMDSQGETVSRGSQEKTTPKPSDLDRAIQHQQIEKEGELPTDYLTKDDSARLSAIQIGLVRPDNLEEAEIRLIFVEGRYDAKLAQCEKIVNKQHLAYTFCKSKLDSIHEELIEAEDELKKWE